MELMFDNLVTLRENAQGRGGEKKSCPELMSRDEVLTVLEPNSPPWT